MSVSKYVCVCVCVCVCVYPSVPVHIWNGVFKTWWWDRCTVSIFLPSSPSDKRLYPEEDLKHVIEKVDWMVLLEYNAKH